MQNIDNNNTSKRDVALWLYKCMGWIGMDGCPGGVKYRASYGANKVHNCHRLGSYVLSAWVTQPEGAKDEGPPARRAPRLLS